MDRNPKPNLDDVVNALERAGCKPRKHGHGYQSRCPAHEDDNPSLSIREGDRAPVVLKCFAGCTFEQIMGALGFELKGTGRPRLKGLPGGKAKKREEPPWPPARLPTIGNDDVEAIYFYPDAVGKPYAAVIRRGKPKRFSQRTHHDGDLWAYKAPETRILYRLPELIQARGRVAIVEGEKDVESIRAAWSNQAATTWSGGTESWKLTDWSPLEGRPVSLLADADSVGRKAMTGLADYLHGLGCDVKIALPAGNSGDDVTKWLEREGPDGAGRLIGEYLQAYTPPPTPIKIDDAHVDAQGLATNEYYRILGLAGDHVAVRIAVGRVLIESRKALTLQSTLISLAPTAYWLQVMANDAGTLTAGMARLLGDHLIREADRLGPVDLSVIAGRGALKTDAGEIGWHLGDRVLIEGVEHPLESGEGLWLAEPRVELTASAPDKALVAMRDAVMAYRWATNADARRFLGWIPAAVAGGAMDFRPHVILAGPAGTGKTWLLEEVVRGLLGPLVLLIGDPTEAAVARMTDKSSLPIIIDEAEPSGKWVAGLLKLLRIGSYGSAARLRADATATGVTIQTPRFCALLSAIRVPQLSNADNSRISLLRLGPAVPNWPTVMDGMRAAMENAQAIRSRMIRDTPRLVESARQITAELQRGTRVALSRPDGKIDTRVAQTAGVLTAGWQWWLGEDSTDDTVVYPYASREDISEARDALLELLSLRIRNWKGEEITVAEALVDGTDADKERLVNMIGIQYDFLDGDLMICPYHKGLAAAVKRTPLDGVDLRRLLCQIAGTEYTKNPRKFGKFRYRAVVISKKVLLSEGIEL